MRIDAAIVFKVTPIDSVSCSKKRRWVSLKCRVEASSITAFTSPSKSTGSTMSATGRIDPIPEPIVM